MTCRIWSSFLSTSDLARSMPSWLQWLTLLNPLRYYQELARAILLKDAGPLDVVPQLVALALFGAAILGLAALRFRRTLA